MTVPNENSVQPRQVEFLSETRIFQAVRGTWWILVNELAELHRAGERSSDTDFQGRSRSGARRVILAVSGGSPFVAVVQSTDLGQCHD
jgi:hypothetical protein